MSNLKVITYNWNETAKNLNKVNTSVTNYGLLAQNVEQYFPELVSVDSNGYRQVDYSRLPLYLLKAVQELSKKVAGMFDGTAEINAKKVKSQELCVGDTCVTEQQLKALLQGQNVTPSQNISTPPPAVEQASTTLEEIITPPAELVPEVLTPEPTPEVVIETSPTE